MTTTGGPEHSLADPALGNAASGDPVVIGPRDADLDGDDIVVEPHAGVPHPRRRTRELVVGIVIAVLVLAGAAIALASRHGSGGDTHVTSSAAVRPPSASHPNQVAANVKPKTTPSQPTAAQIAAATTIVAVQPPTTPVTPATNPSPPVSAQASTPAVIVPPPAPPATAPPSEPPSVLEWTAAPSTLAINSGGHALLTITVVNPTNGNVTLPHPISCAPTLQPVHGSPLGGVVCAEMTQLIAPRSKVVQHYTIYATDTGDASGTPIAAGQYLANVEGLHNVKVTISAS